MVDTPQLRRVDAAGLERLVTQLFAAAGLSEEDATFMGSVLTDADLRGVHSHGTRFAPNYVGGLRRGGMKAQPNRRLVVDAGAVGVYDGDSGVGHLGAAHAMEIAIQKAKEHGIGSVSVRHNGHCGAISYYTQQAVDAGCLGFAATTGGNRIAPWGGVEARTGLNPVSRAAPTGRGWAFDLDMAPSVVAGSKVLMAQARGERLPPGWALDGQGQPSDDPEVAMNEGSLMPIGGHKGVGLSVAVEIMCGVLAGGSTNEQGRAPGQLMQAIDIAHLMPLDEFTTRMEALVADMKNSRLAPGSDGIFLPGELEWNRRQEYSVSGIPLDQPTRQSLRAEAATAGLAYDIEL